MSKSNQSRTGASNNQHQHKLLRGGSFIQPNTATAPAAVLQNDELHAEDLHALTRTSTIMLRPTILLWRQALNKVAKDISDETKKPTNQIASAPPSTIRVIDFKPPPPVTFKGIHRVDGDLQFQWQDRDAAVGGVYQPKVVVSGGGGGHGENGNATKKNKNENEDEDKVIDYSEKQRKLWQPHELMKKDKIAWELLRDHWRDSARKARREIEAKKSGEDEKQGKKQQQQAEQKQASSAAEHLERIRQREEEAKNTTKEDDAGGPDAPENSAQQKKPSQQQKFTSPEEDLEAILRRAQEALGI